MEKKLLLCFVMSVLMIGTFGCGEKSKIVGKWDLVWSGKVDEEQIKELETAEYAYDWQEKHGVTYGEDGGTVEDTYRFEDDGKYMTSGGKKGTWHIEKNNLVLREDDSVDDKPYDIVSVDDSQMKLVFYGYPFIVYYFNKTL